MQTTHPAQRRPVLTRRAKHRLALIFAYAFLVLWSVVSIFPVFWTYVSSIKPPRDVFAIPPKWVFTPTLQNYEVALGLIVPTEQETVLEAYKGAVTSRLPDYFVNTMIVSLGSTLLSMAVGATAAYALARSRVRGRRLMLTVILLTRLIPPIVLVVPLYLLWRNLRLLDTHIGLIVAFFTFSLPFSIWMLRGFFMTLPRELEEAALIDGCSRWGALFRIVVPLAAPGFAATAVFVMLFSWNEFLIAAVLGGEKAKMLTPAIFGYVSDRSVLWGQLYAASGLVMLPVLLFTLLVQRHIATGLAGGAVKG
ncbi:MAG: carbohydrate ABC transporter permease [Chloroflexota bacterium]|nr:MAG: carbohydrate ABC transporter permease [Chloroflexota bacterium]